VLAQVLCDHAGQHAGAVRGGQRARPASRAHSSPSVSNCPAGTPATSSPTSRGVGRSSSPPVRGSTATRGPRSGRNSDPQSVAGAATPRAGAPIRPFVSAQEERTVPPCGLVAIEADGRWAVRATVGMLRR
jgi:hypothetical protein